MSRPSRFMRSMTPSGSVKMSTSKFNIVCGRSREQAIRPNVDRVPNPLPPKPVDARVTTPTLSRREIPPRRERSVSRDVRGPPAPPARDSSFNLPFGSYADVGCHTKPPSRYSTYGGSSFLSGSGDRSRRSMTPLSVGYQTSSGAGYSRTGGSSEYSRSSHRRASATFTQQSFQTTSTRQRHSSCSFGTPASSRGLPFY